MTHVETQTKQLFRALISTADKAGLVEFASQLAHFDIEIIATANTAKLFAEHNIPYIEVSEYTGFPEILGGRVKTLHPKIYGGLLQDSNLHRLPTELAIPGIDLVVVNLYPFQQVIKNKTLSLQHALEYIDIGGASLLRAGAKNFHSVTVVFDPQDYSLILAELETHRGITLNTRRLLAQKAFRHIAEYDSAIAHYLAEDHTVNPSESPQTLHLTYQKKMDLRYGENPHQQGALYTEWVEGKEQSTRLHHTPLQGKQLSFNNFLDADCAYRCVNDFPDKQPTCVIVKHATPAGVAQAENQMEAYQNAYQTDPSAAFGSVIAFNSTLEPDTAEYMLSQHFIEIIIAPDFSLQAREILRHKPDIRLLTYDTKEAPAPTWSYQSTSAGLLAQTMDVSLLDPKNLHLVTLREPTVNEMIDLLFAWQVVKYVKSNAIVCAKNRATLCIGGGQTSRVFALKIAISKAKETGLNLQGSVMASDAFFPFADSIELAHKAGITAIIQPGGSKRDAEVLVAANKTNMAMLFTGQRHFRH